MHRLLVLCLFYGFFDRAYSDEVTTSLYEHCGNMQPQENIQIKLITGIWYVIEILQHKKNERLYNGEKLSIPTCPYIYITFAGSESDLKLHWQEDEGNLEYQFKINDRASPGFWTSTGPQNGTLAQTRYDQFAGTVHVRKAVSDHMVLTFCSPNTQLYSLVLAREKLLDPKELKSITNHMNRVQMPITQTTRTCRNSSTAARASAWLIAALCVTFLASLSHLGAALG